MDKKTMLIILDGWGLNPDENSSAVQKANTPYMDSLLREYPHSTLTTFGPAVGLPEGQMGNSEVGHMNLGAGRVVYQDLMRINKSIAEKELNGNAKLLGALEYARTNNKPLHILGVLSDGGIHGHIEHIKAVATIAADNKISSVYVHAFTDGRDTDPKSGIHFMEDLLQHLGQVGGRLASVAGRYYAMDRDTRWERTALAWKALVTGEGERITNAVKYISGSYQAGITDEFLKPAVLINEKGQPVSTIQDGDVVIFTNFRSDRARQITTALTQRDFPENGMHKLQLRFLPFKLYDKDHQNMEPLFEKRSTKNVMGEVLETYKKTQLRIAETEKYAHVTYFFNNGREVAFEGEARVIIPSPRDVKKYDEKPEMSAYEVRDNTVAYMEEHRPDFVCLNFANPDMVAHTGNFNATVKACEVVDACTKTVTEKALSLGYSIMVLADHGNADYMVNEDGSPNTNHSMLPVPCILVSAEGKKHRLKNGKLGDVAPTLLTLMDLPIPEEMTGDILLAGVEEKQLT